MARVCLLRVRNRSGSRKGEVLVVPAGTTQSFTSVSPSISYLQITVPVIAKVRKPRSSTSANDKVAATMKKAGPLADGPNLRVSGGYRPANLPDASPVSEVHANEADLFYVVEGRATQVLGGSVVGWKADGARTDPRTKTEGGQTTNWQRRRDVGPCRHAALVSGDPRASGLSARQSVLLNRPAAHGRKERRTLVGLHVAKKSAGGNEMIRIATFCAIVASVSLSAQTPPAPTPSVTVTGCVAEVQRDGSLGVKATGPQATPETAAIEANNPTPTDRYQLLDATPAAGALSLQRRHTPCAVRKKSWPNTLAIACRSQARCWRRLRLSCPQSPRQPPMPSGPCR